MKLGLNACSFIVLMLIAGLAIAVPTATACTGYYWDANTKQMVCVEASQLAPTPTATSKASSSAPVSCMWYWDANTKQMVCVQVSAPTATPTTITKTSGPCWSAYLQLMLGYCPPTGGGSSINTGITYASTSSYSGSPGPGYQYFSKICTSLCGCQYNIWVNFNDNCNDDIPG